jgi:hypothetical protein
MLINRDHRGWAGATLLGAALLGAAYAVSVANAPHGPSGGSRAGLAFGILGTTCMVVAALLSARKLVRTRRLGSAQAWMRAHLWLGLLAVPCIWFHSGFALGGRLTTVIMTLFYVVIASGLVGVLLQHVVPAAMTRQVPLETVRGQIDTVVERLATDAYELVASIAGPIDAAADERARLAAEEELVKRRPAEWKRVARQRPAEAPPPEAAEVRELYLTTIRPYLLGSRRPGAAPDVRPLLLRAPEEWRPKLERLQGLCEEARQLAVQQRLHRVLHGWLFIHAPLSLALFVLVAFHIAFALRY